MSEYLIDLRMDITATYITGGALGSDPLNPETFDDIEFHSDNLNHTWRRKLKNGKLKGTIRYKGKPFFDFNFNKERCEIRIIHENGCTTDWAPVDLTICYND